MNSEGEQPKVEGVEPTPSEEAKLTPPQEKPTVGVTETEEFRHELDKALGKSTESLQRQATLSKQAEVAAKAETEKFKTESASRFAYIESLKREVDEALVDDPEKRQAYISRIASLEREQKIAERESASEAKLYQAELRVWQAGMGLKAQQLALEFPGIDPKWLIEGSATEEEMEVKALRWKSTKETKEPEKKDEEPKFDTGLSSGGSLSDDALIKKSASGVPLSDDEKIKVKQILDSLKGNLV